jgi:hypothetical protein
VPTSNGQRSSQLFLSTISAHRLYYQCDEEMSETFIFLATILISKEFQKKYVGVEILFFAAFADDRDSNHF